MNTNASIIANNFIKIQQNIDELNKTIKLNNEDTKKNIDELAKTMKLNINELSKTLNEHTIKNYNTLRDYAEKMNTRDIEYGKRLTTLEGHQSNEDLAIEKEVTDGAIDLVKSIAQKYNLQFTYKTGRNFISNLGSATDNTKLLTNFDGCYILSNSAVNAKVENTKKYNSKPQVSIQAKIKSLTDKITSPSEPSQIRNKSLTSLKKQVNKIETAQKNKNANIASDKTRTSVKESMSQEPIKRIICIIEAKFYVSSEYINCQKQKMHNLIDYFATANLYYEAKKHNKIIEAWNNNFDKICNQFDMNFDGIIIIIGGPYSSKIIDTIFASMKEKFFEEFNNKKIELENKLTKLPSNNEYDILRFIYTTKFNYLSRLIINFDLSLPSGARFININHNSL
jgi:polyhydroxyalkanoate synthesis regulator phasin